MLPRSVGLIHLLPTELKLGKVQKNPCIGMWVTSGTHPNASNDLPMPYTGKDLLNTSTIIAMHIIISSFTFGENLAADEGSMRMHAAFICAIMIPHLKILD